MKKIIIALALAACSSVSMAATTACNVGIQQNVPGATDGSKFVRVQFAPTCSTNTYMTVDDDGTKVWGASASVKGQSVFGGSTNGGSVGNMGPCNSGKACGPTNAASSVSTTMTAAALLGNT